MNESVEILLNVLYPSLGSLSLSIIIFGAYLAQAVLRYASTSRKATSGESSFVLWTVLAIIVPKYSYSPDVKASPVCIEN